MFKRVMLTILSFFLFCTFAPAEEVGFTWNPNTETDLAGYRLYQSTASGVYVKGVDKAVADIPAGTEVTVIQVVEEGIYYYVLTAYDGHGNESDFSNEVTWEVDNTPPDPPTGLSIPTVEVVTTTRITINGETR